MEAASLRRSRGATEKPGSFLMLLRVNVLPMSPNKQKNFTLAGLRHSTKGSSGSRIRPEHLLVGAEWRCWEKFKL